MKTITRWWYKQRRRGWSSERYIRRQLQTVTSSLAFSNSIYAWLIMVGMIEWVTRTPGIPAAIEWTIHPRNVMDESTADQFLAAFSILQQVDHHLMRNMLRYAKLLGYRYEGTTITAEQVRDVVAAVMKVSK